MPAYEWVINFRTRSGPPDRPYVDYVGETPLEACAAVVVVDLANDNPEANHVAKVNPYENDPTHYSCHSVSPGTDSGWMLGSVIRREIEGFGGTGGAGTDCTRFLLPDESGFGWTVKKHVLYEELEGGPPRIRSDFVGATVTVNAAWTVRQKDLARIIGILNNSANSPTNIWLFLDGAIQPTMNLCRLMPGTLRVTTIGLSTRISCSLEATPASEDYDWPTYE